MMVESPSTGHGGTMVVTMTVDARRADEVDRHLREDVRL